MNPTPTQQPGGLRLDDGKIRWDLVDWEAVEEIANVYTNGAKKYAPNNWRLGMAWGKVFRAIFSHCFKFWCLKENYDRECVICREELPIEAGVDPHWPCGNCGSNERRSHHMAHAAWNCLTLFNYSIYKGEFDDRYNYRAKEHPSQGSPSLPGHSGSA